MRTVDFYIDAAKTAQNITSDRDLGRILGFKGTPVSFWRVRKAWPADETIVKLCRLANIDPLEGLTDLGQWRANKPEVREMYSRMAELIKRAGLAAAITLVIFIGLHAPANAFDAETVAIGSRNSGSLYIMGKFIAWLREQSRRYFSRGLRGALDTFIRIYHAPANSPERLPGQLSRRPLRILLQARSIL